MPVTWSHDRGQAGRPDWNPQPEQHPSQVHARRLLDHPDDTGAWDGLAAVYRTQADTWRAWSEQQPDYAGPLRRALDGVAGTDGAVWLEIGAGTGESYPALSPGRRVLHTELVEAMAHQAPARPGGAWTVADARHLPVADRTVDVLFGLNVVPSPAETNRVVRDGGSLVLAYSFGRHTPVYLDPDEVLDRLGTQWEGTAADGPWGTWVRFRRRHG